MVINSKVHQIFFDFGKGKIKNFPLYVKSVNSFKKKSKLKYYLWSEKKVENLLKKKYKWVYKIYRKLKFKIQKVDLARYCILHSEGGFYADLDIICNKSLKPLLKNDVFIINYKHIKNPTWKLKYAEMDFIGFKKHSDIALNLIKYCIKQIKEKSKMKVYKERKYRFVHQTTGPAMFSRFFQLEENKDIKIHEGIVKVFRQEENESNRKYYLLDFHSNEWVNHKDNKIF